MPCAPNRCCIHHTGHYASIGHGLFLGKYQKADLGREAVFHCCRCDELSCLGVPLPPGTALYTSKAGTEIVA